MANIVEYILKMQDKLSPTLGNAAKNSVIARKSFDSLTNSNKALKGMTDKTAMSVNDIKAKIQKLKEYKNMLPEGSELQIRNVNKEIEALNKRMTTLSNVGQSKLKKLFSDTFSRINPLLLNPFTIAGAGIATTINQGIKESEQKLDFQLLLGDNAGSDLFDSIKGQRKLLGDGVFEAGKELLSAGVQADKVAPTLNKLGNVARGNKEVFANLTTTFSQLNKEGILSEQTYASLNDAGFKPLLLISEQTGESIESLKERLNEGKITADEVTKALEASTSEGGVFFGMLDKMSDSPLAKLQSFKIGFVEMASSFGELLMPIVEGGLQILTIGFGWLNEGVNFTINLFKDIADWASENKSIILGLGGAILGGVIAYKLYNFWQIATYLWSMKDLVATSLLATGKGILSVVTGKLTLAQLQLNAAFLLSPIGWVVGSLALLTGAVVYAWNEFEGFRVFLFSLWESFKQVLSNIGDLFAEIFGPIVDTFQALKSGDFLSAGKALMKLTPTSIMYRTASFIYDGGLTKGVSDAWAEGSKKGKESWLKSQESKDANEKHFGFDEDKLAQYLQSDEGFGSQKNGDKSSRSVTEGINAVSGGGSKTINITIEKFVENFTNHFNSKEQGVQDIEKMFEEMFLRIVSIGE